MSVMKMNGAMLNNSPVTDTSVRVLVNSITSVDPFVLNSYAVFKDDFSFFSSAMLSAAVLSSVPLIS